jgi:hypothetical protein
MGKIECWKVVGKIGIGWKEKKKTIHNQWHLSNYCEVGIAGMCKI